MCGWAEVGGWECGCMGDPVVMDELACLFVWDIELITFTRTSSVSLSIFLSDRLMF